MHQVLKAAIMSSVTVRNIPDEVHRALRVRAAQHGRSTEAEIHHILEDVVRPSQRVKLGSALVAIAREAGGLTQAEAQSLEQLRDRSPAQPLGFE